MNELDAVLSSFFSVFYAIVLSVIACSHLPRDQRRALFAGWGRLLLMLLASILYLVILFILK